MAKSLADFRSETIGGCTLYLGDCREILPLLPKVDAVVTDPPYGVGTWNDRGNPKLYRRRFKEDEWRKFDCAPRLELLNELIALSHETVIFGGNHFGLPATKQVFVWDKTFRGLHFNDAELAYGYGCKQAVRVFRFQSTHDKKHPAEKPISVMLWVCQELRGETILDPFMGSGTTGVACVKLGRKFIGIEIDETYFEIACKRIRDAYAQPDMFIEAEKPKAVQEMLDL